MDSASLERIERLLALILLHDLKDAPQADRAMQLSRAGFSNAEIAGVLGTTANVVNQQLYMKRKGSPKKKTKRKAK